MEEMAVLNDGSAENEAPATTGAEPVSIIVETPKRKNPWRLPATLLVITMIATNSFWISIELDAGDDLSEANTTIDQLESYLDEARQINDGLESDLSSLESDYERLNEDYDDLESEYALLSEDYQLYERLSLESLASDFYEAVRKMYDPFVVTDQDGIDFCAALSKHNQAEVYFPSLEDSYYDFYKSHSYEDAVGSLDFVLEYAGISSYDSDVVRLTKILAFINEFIEWQPDMDERYLAPVETLAYGSGDCEDFSILASALFELAGVDSALGFFTDPAEMDDHAMVLIHLDDLDGLEYWYYSDLTDEGLSSGRWIIIEPQWLIGQQGTDSISDWSLQVAADT